MDAVNAMENEAEPTRLDLRGLKCPLPVLRARKALRAMAPGARLVVDCTDPMAAIDIPHFAHQDAHILEAQDKADGVLTFTLRRGAKARSK